MLPVRLPPLLSWGEFLDAATAEPSIDNPSSRKAEAQWQAASWAEALRLAVDGWPLALDEAEVTVGELRERAGLPQSVVVLEPTWDVTGSEVDIGAYLAGVPECMVDAVPQRISTRGKVITFLIPAGYTNQVEHSKIINRGLALATLCTAIIDAGHSVEIWSGFTGILHTPGMEQRFRGVARVISAGEPLDVGRLIFAVAHPAMLRRLWFGVWDAQPHEVATAMKKDSYGGPPYTCRESDLPAEVTDPYVFPYLERAETQWDDLGTAMAWVRQMFTDLGLIHD